MTVGTFLTPVVRSGELWPSTYFLYNPPVYKSQSIKVSTCMYNVHKTCKTVNNLWTPISLFTSLAVYIIVVPFSHVCFHCDNMINMAPKDTFENCYDMTDRFHMLWLWITCLSKIFEDILHINFLHGCEKTDVWHFNCQWVKMTFH